MKKIVFYLIFMNLVTAFAQMAPPPQNLPSSLAGLRVGPSAFPFEKGLLRPFRSEGCSLSPGSVPGTKISWATCCVQHDLAYWLGGTEKERLTADENLKSCIQQKANSIIGEIYFSAVRMGGRPHTWAGFRWGYGWNYVRPYSILSDDERAQAQSMYGQKLEGLAQAIDLKIIASNSKLKFFDHSVQPIQTGEPEIYNYLKNTLRGSTSVVGANFMDLSSDVRQFRLVLESCPGSEIIFEITRSSSEIKRITDEHSCLSKVGENGEETPHSIAF